ncbi:hypothetical protein V8C86DRAFT_3034578 [Haematococcus lacustris]
MWYQDPVCQDPVVWCQDPVDPVVWYQDPVGQDPVVRCHDPVVSTCWIDRQEAMVEGYLQDQDWDRHHHQHCPSRKAMKNKGELFVSYPQTKRERALREMRWFEADLLGMAADEVVEDGLPWWHEGQVRKQAAKDKALAKVNNLP